MEINNLFKASNNSLEKIKNIPKDFNKRYISSIDIKNRIVIGPRGVGKSTYLLYVASQYKKSEVLYLDIDSSFLIDFDFRNSNASLQAFKSNLNFILEKGQIKILLIDEIQNFYDWSYYLKQLVDSFPNLIIIATGSDARSLNNGNEIGTRRYDIFFLGFYTYNEFKMRFSHKTLEDYINNWSFANQNITDEQVYQSVYEKQLSLTRLKGFVAKNYLKLISLNPGSSFNVNNVVNNIFESSMVKPDHSQIKEIINFFEKSALIYKIEDEDSTSRIRKKTNYRIYPADWNLFRYFIFKNYKNLDEDSTPRKGLVFENMIISNVYSHFNSLLGRNKIRTIINKPDVDLIICDQKYEIKSFNALNKEHKDYQRIIDKALITGAKVIHKGLSKILVVNPVQKVEYINVEKFLLEIKKL